MRGDDTQPTVARSGPRHAAPRKTLLNRIQGPAGKAMALAAMPTAVLMGMGLAPSPALADEKDIPFAPGPCVSRSDEPVAEETTATPTAKATETAKPEPTATATATTPAEPTGQPTATPSATATPTATASPSATTAAQGGAQAVAPEAAATATAAPTPTQSANPLDPLGVGDALKDLFGGLAPKQEPTATPSATATPTASATTAAPQQRATTTDETQAPKTDTAKTDTAADAKAADTEADATKAAIKEAAEKAGVKVQELPESAQGLEAKPDTDIPDGAKPRFPCPERDDAALAAAELEPGIPLLPDEPWRLESTRLTLSGLKYHGIVEVRTYGGKVKKVLKFTATYIGIKDLHQITEHSEGREAHVRSRKGSESTITGGTVTMYTEELKGNLLGIIPITFGPESPPPLDLPAVFFTNVKLKQAGQFGGTLRVKDLRNTIEPS
ncbi:hypothetical protein [Streptomyces roseolus]|uniref:hypothetical protein n=1 Tax=Streptomyces roseolus TaxID=67358 RepID=UPI001673D4B1|nr:hypothetical protein [Streptomyces roseolus]GGR32754.1 hypothetical protein GCM10010282_26480 [Streptomyces roseolus]